MARSHPVETSYRINASKALLSLPSVAATIMICWPGPPCRSQPPRGTTPSSLSPLRPRVKEDRPGWVSFSQSRKLPLPFFLRGSTRRGWSFSSPQLPLSALLVWLIRSCHLFPLSLLAAGLIGSSWTDWRTNLTRPVRRDDRNFNPPIKEDELFIKSHRLFRFSGTRNVDYSGD